MSIGPRHVLRQGVYAPILTTFKHDNVDEIDLVAFSACVARLARADVGMIIGGTLGEGPLLSRDEKMALTKCARETITGLNLDFPVPIIYGIMGASVSECINMSKDAEESGADAV